MTTLFDSTKTVKSELSNQKYIASDEIATLVYLSDKLAKEEDVFFSNRFLLQRPLLKAILSEKPTVLLIDEIDRADAEFEAFLLEVLSDFQVSVPELGTLSAKHKPF